MKISDEKEQPTVPSAFDQQPGQMYSPSSFYDQKERYVQWSVRRPIKCSSQKNINFMNKLVMYLSNCPYFMGSAVLEQGELKQGREFRICYSFLYYLGEEQQDNEGKGLEMGRRCDKIHSKLQQLNSKYRIENRVIYWQYMLQKQLRNVLLDRQEELVVDRSLKLFDSN